MFKRKKIGQLLIEAGHVGEKELNIALAEQKKRGKPKEILVKNN